jgi:hypothetical protein
MKKFAIGCAIVLVVLLVVGGVGGYFLYQKFVAPVVGPMTEFVTNAQKMADIEKDIRNKSSFTAPANGELTEEMVTRFVKVQSHIQSKLGARMEELRATYDKLDKTLSNEQRKASFTEAISAMRDLTTLLVDAKKAQVEGLNDAGFSVKEYEWIRTQVYAAVGMVAGGFDVKKLAEQAKAGNVEGFSGGDKASLPDVPEKNKELVAPYEKQLKEWAPLAFFGF